MTQDNEPLNAPEQWEAEQDRLADRAADALAAGSLTPRTETGLSLADGEPDGLTEMICQIELEAVALVAPRAVVLNWISVPMSAEVDIDVIISGGRALVGEQTLRLMAQSIRDSQIASPEDDALYADSILATERRSDGFYDVTDEPALSDQVIEYGVGRASDFEASL